MHWIKNLLFILGISLITTSCTSLYQTEQSNQENTSPAIRYNAKASLYLDEDATPRQACNPQQVRFFFIPSTHPCIRLGIIRSYGNGYATFDDCINAAKRKAAEVGADFIVQSDSGTTAEDCYGLKITRPWADFTVWTFRDSEQET